MTSLHTLRVFLGPDGEGGNPLGVFLDGGDIAPADRQAVAADLGFSETVFVDDRATGELRIFTPGGRAPARGPSARGTSWLLGVDTLRPPAGDVPTWSDRELHLDPRPAGVGDAVRPRAAPVPAAVDAFAIPGGDAMVGVWAWEDEAAGRLRARIFPNGIGIDEDEATGAAAIQFGALLGRDVVIHQGEGSELHARPGGDGTVAVGGRVELVSERRYAPAGVA